MFRFITETFHRLIESLNLSKLDIFILYLISEIG